MRTLLSILVPALLVIALSGCQSTKVVVDYDTNADFSNIHHYEWLLETSGSEEGFDPLIADRARNAIEAQLKLVPMTPITSAGQADILVRYYVGTYTRNKESNTRSSVGFGSAGGSTAMGLALSFPLGGNTVVKEAQIIVDFVNPADKKLKWRGTNRIKIGDESPEEITVMMNEAVAEIFSHYPPGKEDK